ncbi:unnamed protein product [Calypogeia fissa]
MASLSGVANYYTALERVMDQPWESVASRHDLCLGGQWNAHVQGWPARELANSQSFLAVARLLAPRKFEELFVPETPEDAWSRGEDSPRHRSSCKLTRKTPESKNSEESILPDSPEVIRGSSACNVSRTPLASINEEFVVPDSPEDTDAKTVPSQRPCKLRRTTSLGKFHQKPSKKAEILLGHRPQNHSNVGSMTLSAFSVASGGRISVSSSAMHKARELLRDDGVEMATTRQFQELFHLQNRDTRRGKLLLEMTIKKIMSILNESPHTSECANCSRLAPDRLSPSRERP